jgi:hypothetical protein
MITKTNKKKNTSLWNKLEDEIQRRSKRKDPKFNLSGKWKRFVRKQDGLRIYAVDGEWIRSNLCIYFGHGGHGLVHEFIPVDEIWISIHHYHEGKSRLVRCGCKRDSKTQKVSDNFFESSVIHELFELKHMKMGKKYRVAHDMANKKEIEIGLIVDPYDDRQY